MGSNGSRVACRSEYLNGRSQSGADGQLSPKLTFRLKVCSGAERTSAMQRVLPVGAAKRTHADCHEAAVGHGDRCSPKWRLYEVLRHRASETRLPPRHRLLPHHLD